MFRFNNQIILKLTRDCNLRCEYCYLKNKDKFKGEMMTFETFEKVIERIVKERKLQNNKEKISIVFHGGEPTLISKNDMIKFLNFAETRFNEENINYGFNMQSNLVNIDEDWAQILTKYNIKLGASFDGIDNGMERRTKTHKQESFYNTFDLLKKHNVSFSFLMVAGSNNVENSFESTRFIIDKYDLDSVKINYLEDTTGKGLYETDGETFFMYAWKPFLDEFIYSGNLYESNTIHLLKKFVIDYLTYSLKTEKSNCGGKICGGGINIVEVEPDGRVYYCGRYAEEYEEAYIEDVKDKDFLALTQIKRYTDFIIEKHKVIVKTGCDECIADGICDHGCMAFHKSIYNKWGIRKEIVCDIFKSFHKYCSENVINILLAIYKKDRNSNGEARIFIPYTILKIRHGSRIVNELRNKHNIKIGINENNKHELIMQGVNNESHPNEEV